MEPVSQVRDLQSSIVDREETSIKKRKPEFNMNESYQKAVSSLTSDPFLELKTTFSFSSLHNPDLLFRNDNVYYSAGSILVSKNIKTGEQHFMQGHTDYIVAMDSVDEWIITVQEGAKSGVRIWIDHKCICSFQCPYERVQQIRLSNKKHLAMVGLDPYKRQAILVFDISQI